MSPVLAKLRGDLDVLPSPLADRPGLMLRDPFRYTDAVMVVPVPLGQCLALFDGAHSDRDLRELLFQITGRIDLVALADDFVQALSEAGFLDDDAFRGMRAGRHAQFAEAPVREAAFAGGAYPAGGDDLGRTLGRWIEDGRAATAGSVPAEVVAIAAPHASPHGAVSAYGAAYAGLPRDAAEATFVVLGTSHYGHPNRFGLTRKPFRTPFGQAITDSALVDELVQAAPQSAEIEDYCHAIEHSIEFQLVFLQALYGPVIRILPVLCGPFLAAGEEAEHARPESHSGVARMLDALANLQARHGSRLRWVLGVDMAHVGRRYGDPVVARAHAGAMTEVAARDRARLDRIVAGDASGFWDLTHENGGDDLKWCGSSPIYTFLKANPGVRGHLKHYDQWNIDDASVVSFAALAFSR